jgi:hypothetical protein
VPDQHAEHRPGDPGLSGGQQAIPARGLISDDPNKVNPPQRGSPPPLPSRSLGIASWHDPLCTPDSLEVPMYNWVVEILPYIGNC